MSREIPFAHILPTLDMLDGSLHIVKFKSNDSGRSNPRRENNFQKLYISLRQRNRIPVYYFYVCLARGVSPWTAPPPQPSEKNKENLSDRMKKTKGCVYELLRI